jgi:hypothetical protein
MAPSHPPYDNLLAHVDWWYRTYGCACPQSHLARELRLDVPHLRVHLHRLVAAGVLEWRHSGLASEPDIARRRRS